MQIAIQLTEKMENFAEVFMSEEPVTITVTGKMICAYQENGLQEALEKAEKYDTLVDGGIIDEEEMC